jgi:site-specific recombinase XerD
MESVLYDAAGHRRSPATMPGYHEGRPPRNKGLRYPADPPTVEEIVAVVRAAGDGPDGARLRALIVILWRAGLRIGEALDLAETDLDRARGAVLVRRGKGGRRREVGMDRWGWAQLEPWLEFRTGLSAGALLCVIHGATAGRHWEQSAARKQLHRTAILARVRRRFAPHQLRHAHAVEMAHEGVPLVVIQRQLGHAHLGITSIYLQGIDSAEIIDTVHSRPAPVISATAGLRASR